MVLELSGTYVHCFFSMTQVMIRPLCKSCCYANSRGSLACYDIHCVCMMALYCAMFNSSAVVPTSSGQC